MPAFTVAATLPAYPVVTPGDLVTVDGSIRPRPGLALRRVPAPDRCRGHADVEVAGDRAGARQSRPAPRAAAAWRGPRVDARPAGAGGGTGRRDPHRPAGPGRSRPRRGLHHGRRQSRRRHLGLEHRDRRGGHRRDDGPSGTSPPVGRDDRRDRALRRVRRRVRLGGPRGADGGRRPPGARERASRPCDRRPRLGRHAPARLGPGAHRRCRVPALVTGDGRSDRLGDTAHRVARASRRRAGAGLAGREPRGLARCAGGDPADHPRLVRPAGGAVAARQPARRAARRAGDGRRCAGPGGRRRGRRRGTARPRGGRRRARLGRPAVARHHRRHGGEPPVRERHAPAAPGHRGGCAVGGRDRGRDVVASPTAGRSHRADEPVDPGQGTAHDHIRATGGRRAGHVECEPSAATRERRCPAPQPGCHRLGRDRPTGRDRARSPSSTSGRATPSSSRDRAAAACSSTVVRIRAA